MQQTYMTLALELAKQGLYSVSPNPMVGCVIVKDNQIVGQGFHQRAGGHHAEIMALEQAQENAKGATAYVTLEPCCHFGKTPPCTDALIKAGIKHVVAACQDPNALVSGKGFAALKAAGITVEIGLLETEAKKLNEIFFHFIQHKKPFVFAKWAMSLDGKTITHLEDNKNISCNKSREHSHQLRQQVDAILIGAKTALHDDPSLSIRYPEQTIKQPLRIILSSRNTLPLNLKIFNTELQNTLVITTQHSNKNWIQSLQEKNIDVLTLPENKNGDVDLHFLMSELGKRKITSLLVEGGMTVLQDFFNENLVNKIHAYIAPLIIGSLKTKQIITNVNLENIERDFFVTGDFN